jgi:hypothetical protein
MSRRACRRAPPPLFLLRQQAVQLEAAADEPKHPDGDSQQRADQDAVWGGSGHAVGHPSQQRPGGDLAGHGEGQPGHAPPQAKLLSLDAIDRPLTHGTPGRYTALPRSVRPGTRTGQTL